MKLIAYAMCGSFCTHAAALDALRFIMKTGEYRVLPVLSETAATTDTRFGYASDLIAELRSICGVEPITTIKDAEPLGPVIMPDAVVIAPCTGNTAAKLARGITDTSVTMAAKCQLRRNKPLVLAVATNDGLGANFSTLAELHNRKNITLVPMRQDDAVNKPNSLIADMTRVPETLDAALRGIQPLPLFIP